MNLLETPHLDTATYFPSYIDNFSLTIAIQIQGREIFCKEY